MNNRYGLVVAALALSMLSACGAQAGVVGGGVTVKGAWVRAAVQTGMAMPTDMAMPAGEQMDHSTMGSTSAAYLTLVNGGSAPDSLVKVTADLAEAAEFHNNTIDSNGVARMRPLESIDIPAGDEVELKPGGRHIMLIGIKRDLKVGDSVKLTLIFKSGRSLDVTAPVQEQGP